MRGCRSGEAANFNLPGAQGLGGHGLAHAARDAHVRAAASAARAAALRTRVLFGAERAMSPMMVTMAITTIIISLIIVYIAVVGVIIAVAIIITNINNVKFPIPLH